VYVSIAVVLPRAGGVDDLDLAVVDFEGLCEPDKDFNRALGDCGVSFGLRANELSMGAGAGAGGAERHAYETYRDQKC
jgi:hypothetical protein